MKKLIFGLFALLLNFAAVAQNIKGTVKNSSGEGIAFANISVLNANAGTNADRDGQFSLNLAAGDYQIAVSALGFAPKVLAIEATDRAAMLDIVLETSTEKLGEVVVTANKREEDILRVATSITSLSAQKVEQTRTVGLGNLTGLVPNYLYSELGVSFQQVQSIRGIQVFSENPAVATYIDDVNNLDILANGMMFTDIERIEVLRGGRRGRFSGAMLWAAWSTSSPKSRPTAPKVLPKWAWATSPCNATRQVSKRLW